MSRRGGDGSSWWAEGFTRALEAGTEPGRLARGRAYAADGAVRDLKVVPGEVRARVAGSGRSPYRVSLIRVCLAEEDWERVLGALAGQPLFRARLFEGVLPPEVERVFGVLGLDLFPRGLDDLVLTCSCPDWGGTCKHVAATLTALSEAVGRDPFLLTTWLGMARGDFLAGLRRHARGAADAEDAGSGTEEAGGSSFPDTPRPRAEPLPDLPADPVLFWADTVPPEPAPPRPRPAIYAADPADGDGGDGGGGGDGGDTALLDALEPLYRRMTEASPDDV